MSPVTVRDIAYLVNRGRGVFQTRTAGGSRLIAAVRVYGTGNVFKGSGPLRPTTGIYVMTWLRKVPWMCVVQAERHVIFARLGRVRLIGIYVLILSGMMIVGTVLLSTSYLVFAP